MTSEDVVARRVVRIRNRLGMHARAAVKFVQTANRFACDVHVEKEGQVANGKSIMGLLTLVAAFGMQMTIVCSGPEAEAAADALAALVEGGFDEGIEEHTPRPILGKDAKAGRRG